MLPPGHGRQPVWRWHRAPVSVDQVATIVPCGPDPEKHLNAIHPYIEAGFDHIFIHQIGPNQEPFMDFCAREISPKITKLVGDHGLEAA